MLNLLLLQPWAMAFLLSLHPCFRVLQIRFRSITKACPTIWTPWTAARQGFPCPSPSPGGCWNPCPSSRWCHPTISPSVVPFSSFPQSFPASGSFPMSQLFASGGQRIGDSASASVLLVNIQGWFPSGLTCCSMMWHIVISYDDTTFIQSVTYIPILLSLAPTPHPSRSSQSPELSSLCYRAASHSLSVSHVVAYMCQCYSLCPSHPLLLLLCPHIPSLCLHLYSCPAKRSICTTESEVLSWENYNTGGFLLPWLPSILESILSPWIRGSRDRNGWEIPGVKNHPRPPLEGWRYFQFLFVCLLVGLLSWWLLSSGASALHKSVCTALACVFAVHSCLILWDPVGCSPPGSSVHGIFWARILEWTAMPFSGDSLPCCCCWVTLCDPTDSSMPRLPCPSPTLGACSNSCPLSRWCHPAISSSVIPFSSCLQSFPASGSFPVSWLFASGSQTIGASASALVLPVNIQGWFPVGWTGLMSLQCKELSPSLAGIYWRGWPTAHTRPLTCFCKVLVKSRYILLNAANICVSCSVASNSLWPFVL